MHIDRAHCYRYTFRRFLLCLLWFQQFGPYSVVRVLMNACMCCDEIDDGGMRYSTAEIRQSQYKAMDGNTTEHTHKNTSNWKRSELRVRWHIFRLKCFIKWTYILFVLDLTLWLVLVLEWVSDVRCSGNAHVLWPLIKFLEHWHWCKCTIEFTNHTQLLVESISHTHVFSTFARIVRVNDSEIVGDVAASECNIFSIRCIWIVCVGIRRYTASPTASNISSNNFSKVEVFAFIKCRCSIHMTECAVAKHKSDLQRILEIPLLYPGREFPSRKSFSQNYFGLRNFPRKAVENPRKAVECY